MSEVPLYHIDSYVVLGGRDFLMSEVPLYHDHKWTDLRRSLWFLHVWPSLDALRLRSDVIGSIQIFACMDRALP